MVSSANSTKVRRSVVAVTQSDGWMRAVELADRGNGFEVVWAKRDDDQRSDWCSFAKKCGLLDETDDQKVNDKEKTVIAGFESSGVAFYRLEVPATVEKDEIGRIVRLQAESRLPLPADQMELSWRASHTQNGQMPVTMAAARKERLRVFVEQVSCFAPDRILLDSEGVVESWSRLFGGNERATIVLSVGARSTQVCLARGMQLSNAVFLDVGMDDFRTIADSEHTGAAERFVQDMRSVLGMFGIINEKDCPIIVMSDGDVHIERMVETLVSAGLNARLAMPNVSLSLGQSGLRKEDLYDYRIPIGLGLMALDGERDVFNLFDNLYKPEEEEEGKHWIYSPKVAVALAGVMILVFLVMSYAIDVATPGALERRLKASLSETDLKELIAQQNLTKSIAQARPDLLSLIKLVNDKGGSGIKLTGFHFKKGQVVSITGEARNQDDLFRFQESLMEDKSIKKAVIPNATADSSGNKVTFTLNFMYKNFSEKTRRTSSIGL